MFEKIPAIDIIDGKVVRLRQGDYNQVTVYSDHPELFAKKWQDAGANIIHLVDLDGAKEGKPINLAAIKKIREKTSCKLELGGGIRTRENVLTLLELGIDRVILGSVALKNPTLTRELLQEFGGDKIVIGIDAKNGYVATEGWLETSTTKACELFEQMAKDGVKSVIYTDISKDGMLQGPNLEAYAEIVNQTNISVIASGGISSLADISALQKISGLGGTIVGKALYENKFTVEELFNA